MPFARVGEKHNIGVYSVFVERLQFHGYHGVSDSERTTGHRFSADLEVVLDGGAVSSDKITETIDYTGLVGLVLDVSSAARFQTVEALGSKICDECLVRFQMVSEVRLRLRKIHPPIESNVAATGVQLVRFREQM